MTRSEPRSIRRSIPGLILRPVLIALLAGWLVALLVGLGLARLQYVEVSSDFPPDKVATEYESRLDRELREGPLLLLAQIGVMAGVLVWQVGRTAGSADHPLRYGVGCGAALALIQGVIAGLMHAPWTFTIPLMLVLIAAGTYAGWSVVPGLTSPPNPLSAGTEGE